MKKNKLDNKSKKIIQILSENSEPITTDFLANKLNVSSRTILRKMPNIEKYLKEHRFNLIKKPGYGLVIEGEAEEKIRLKELLTNNKFKKKYTPEERQLFILIELLKSKEPIKIYRFQSELNVTGGTISFDLDKVEDALNKYNIRLIRKPGVGVYIDGDETLLRKLMVSLIYKTHSYKEILDILKNSLENNDVNEKDSIKIRTRNRLLNMIDKESIETIEKIVYDMEKLSNNQLNDSQYVALIVHIALVIERIKNGEKIKIDNVFLEGLKNNEEFSLAQKLANDIEEAFAIEIPIDEVGYITMHLMGSRKYFDRKNNINEDFFIEKYKIVKIARKIIGYFDSKLNIKLMQDDKILIDLAIHLEPAIKRLKMNMDIRNPLLDQIKNNYPKLFELSKEASKILEDELSLKVPDTEVGYIALHIGGAIERAKSYRFNVLVVCPSGIGTSRLLSSKLEKEFSNLKVVDTVSFTQLSNGDLKDVSWDFIVSTVPFDYKDMTTVIVNPFLLEEDKIKIKAVIDNISSKTILKQNNKNMRDLKESIIKNINYGKAALQVLNNFKYFNDVELYSYKDIIEKISEIYTDTAEEYETLKKDIIRRESLGRFVLDESGTIVVHCRSHAIDELHVGILKLKDKLKINENNISFVIVLLAPKDIDKEFIETISRISQELFKEKILNDMSENELYKYIYEVIEDWYFNLRR